MNGCIILDTLIWFSSLFISIPPENQRVNEELSEIEMNMRDGVIVNSLMNGK